MSDMPKEIWAWRLVQEYTEHNESGSPVRVKTTDTGWYNEGGCDSTSYTLTSHHTVEIEKRDRAIENMQNALIRLATCSDPFVVDIAERALDQAQAILGGTQEPIDIEALKRDEYKDSEYNGYGCPKSKEEGWNDCIDHLHAKGII